VPSGFKSNLKRRFSLACLVFAGAHAAVAGPLEDYVARTDPHFNWKRTEQIKTGWGTVARLELVSQHWRGQFWSHYLLVARPNQVRHPEIAFLFITGDGNGDKNLDLLETLAVRAGAVTAVLTKVPNQPLYDGRKEDALIAYTFDQYLKTGDESWPLLFAMVKSAVRGMDAVQAFAREDFNQSIGKFVLSGASKRGWTTWLTGAVDLRVKAIAPMVIDMLNMKAQLQWAEKVYGKQSEEIADYTELNLHQKIDDPPMQKLRSWVDPYAYRDRYTMPKLLLLGTNDPYWTVDSLRHYWNDLPGPKLIFQTPNAGHDLGGGKEALQTLAAFFQMIADNQPLPKVEWTYASGPNQATLAVKVDQKAKAIRLWTSASSDRDFRDEKWSSRDLAIESGSSAAVGQIETPKNGYRACLVEVELTSPTGHTYKLSTEARVAPDTIR
jgi:PhoPQ-activated pathogenicity-related protein